MQVVKDRVANSNFLAKISPSRVRIRIMPWWGWELYKLWRRVLSKSLLINNNNNNSNYSSNSSTSINDTKVVV